MAVSAVLTPAVEQLLHRLGYRRVCLAVAAVATAGVVLMGVIVGLSVTVAPIAAPAAVADAILAEAAGVFGAEEDQPSDGAVTADEQPRCVPAAASTTTVTPPTPSFDSAAPAEATGSEDARVQPIPVGPDGAIDISDAHLVVDPVPPGSDALTANVWFLYRLGGLGDWDEFIESYRLAGFGEAADDTDPDVVLARVQALNHRGVDLAPYRLTAAALTMAGQVSGRLVDPYPQFREVVAIELQSGCFGDVESSELRATMPPANTTALTTPPPLAPLPAESSSGGA